MEKFNWSPGLGDPTVMGWFTVLLYVATATYCIFLGRRFVVQGAAEANEGRLWLTLGVVFLALGINKQLDLQSALTELGRVLAHAQGWYEQRHLVQLVFVILMAVFSFGCFVILSIWVRRVGASAWLALIGSALLLTFIFVRAASFHHIDHFIDTRFAGLRWNWILEISGILLVLLASRSRIRSTASTG